MSRIAVVLACALCALLPAGARAQGNAAGDGQTYLSMQVETQAKLKSSRPPMYPSKLKASRVEGEVLVQFIVDERGRPQMDSFKVLRSSDAEFTESVKRAVATTSFFPAEIGGRKVKQLVQMPFKFKATS
jgi:protein TonB